MLNIFAGRVDEGPLSHGSRGLSDQETGKLLDMLLTCLADSQLAIALYDASDQLRFANLTFRSAFGIAADTYPTWSEIIRNCYRTGTGLIIKTDDIDGWIGDISTRRRQVASRTFECDLTDGRWLRMTETVSHEWMLCVASDITEQKSNEHLLKRAHDSALTAAQTDSLTGAYNRRFTLSRFREMLAQAYAPGGGPVSVAVVDLDHFKQINDTYGHLAGDRVLQYFVAQARNNLRPTDILGRIGGEEFLLLLPRTPLARAVQVVERLLREVSRTAPLLEWPEFRFGFSAGVAESDASDSVDELFQRADEALYAAKQDGRNRVATSGTASPT